MKNGEVFGTTEAGEDIRRFSIRGGGLTANIIGLGAIIQDLRLAGHDAPLVLGFDRLAPYETDTHFFGTVVGRYANRIRDGRFTLAGERHQLDRNFLDRHLLHGGSNGYFHRPWTVSLHGRDFVTLTLHDPAGSMGFPGALEVTCTYRLKIPGTLSVELTATCEEPTVCNLTQHSYFNLKGAGNGDVLKHRLQIFSDAVTPTDTNHMATGEVMKVSGTGFDFTRPKPIGKDINGPDPAIVATPGYDINFIVRGPMGKLRPAAKVTEPETGRVLDVWTTQPGIQLYLPNNRTPIIGKGGKAYVYRGAFCLETQHFANSPNIPSFPTTELKPGQVFHEVTEFRFSTVK